MTNGGDIFHPGYIPLEQAYEMSRDKAIIELQEQVRRLTRKLE